MLKKKISLISGISIAISMVVGSGVFGIPGLVIEVTNPITALSGWFIIIAMMPFMLIVFSFLGQQYPLSGGVSLYACIGLGKWSKNGLLLLTSGTLAVGMPAFFIVGGSYLAVLFDKNPEQWATPCAIGLAIITTIINILGIKILGWVNNIAVVLIICTIGYITVSSIPNVLEMTSSFGANQLLDIEYNGVWLAASIIFWAFQGWENLTFGFEEVKNPHTNIPLIFAISFVFVSSIYIVLALSISAAAISGINVHGLSGLSAMLPENIFGKFFLIIIIIVLVSNANSWVFGSSRAFLSSAEAGVLPNFITKLNSVGTPVSSLIATLFLYIFIMILMNVFHVETSTVFLLTTQGFIILYGGAILAYIRLTKGVKSRIVAGISTISWIFLMQGFGLMIIYPLVLMFIGTFMIQKNKV